jgi:hypothetical protein
LELDDPVPFRFHWPLNSVLTVNTAYEHAQIKATNRGPSCKLGLNQRDEPVELTKFVQMPAGTTTQVRLTMTVLQACVLE